MFTPNNYALVATIDHRSEHTFITIGWPAAVSKNYAETVTAVTEQTNQSVGNQPLLTKQDNDQQAGSASFVLSPANAQAWVQYFMQALDEKAETASAQATVAIVAPETVVQSFPEPAAPSAFQAVEVTANLQRYQQGSTEHIIITGPEPATKAGSLETFVAMCLLMNPANPLVASWLPAGINLQPMRALIEGKPHIIWSFSGDNGESKETLEILGSVAQAIVNIPETYSETEFEQVKKFAFSNLSRSHLAPDDLARFLAQYSVMGWGVDALLDIHRIDSLSLEDLAPAFAGLVYPIGAVLGIDLG